MPFPARVIRSATCQLKFLGESWRFNLKMLFQLLQYSFSKNLVSVEEKYRLPDYVVYSGKRDTQYTGKSKSVFTGEKSYQSKLSREVTVEGEILLFSLSLPYCFFPN